MSRNRRARREREGGVKQRRDGGAPWRQWGTDLDPAAIAQMENACALPVAVQGALMPDAHVGYGLPIGGVLATEDAVIPYAVGVDIACRMRLTVLDWPANALEGRREELIQALESRTRFGAGRSFERPFEHPVLERDWNFSRVIRGVREKAVEQLGTSGSGNHFVEFGRLECVEDVPGVPEGKWLALLSHSGSRGAGATVAKYFSDLAMNRHADLPKEMRHLAWLSMAHDEGREYWRAMELMADYAAANHDIIHRRILEALGARAIWTVENHHNLAWRERHGGRDLIVHRKGATPASEGTLGIVPGSMATPAFVVRGLGNAESLDSASHGAGRRMSRTVARKRFKWAEVRRQLDATGVTLLSAGLDEAPDAYKDIHQVMREQADLVEVVARFDPVIVKMDR